MTLAFTVYGVAQPKGSMRALQLKGMAFPIVTDSNRSTKSWQQLVAAGASTAIEMLAPDDRALLFATLGVRLSLAFYLPRPKKHTKRGVFVPHCVKPDIDKLTRSVLDALTGVAYHDDRQVTEVVQGKYYAAVDEPPRITVRVEPAPGHPLTLEQGRSLLDMIGAMP